MWDNWHQRTDNVVNLPTSSTSTLDPLESKEGDLVDSAFNKRITDILDTVESLENMAGHRDRQTVWMQLRVSHKIKDMSDNELKQIVMNTWLDTVHVKPEYFTAICGEIMERILWSVPRVD